MVAIGEKEENTPWNIGVERPYSDRSEVIGVVEAVVISVVTSGIYERIFEKDGKNIIIYWIRKRISGRK